jgi:ABC-type lipoprotein release transport system permease subunit
LRNFGIAELRSPDLLYATAPWDPATVAAVTGLLVAVSVLAACLPGRRAMRLDPLVALRHQ